MRLLSLAALLVVFAFAGRSVAADFPKGTFTTKADDHDWEVTFDGKDKFEASRDGKKGIKGTYKVEKDEVTFTEEEGDFASKGEDGKYTYKWKLDGKKLSFTKVKDNNPGREKVITGQAWEKKE